ncbi:MAG: GerMN domain-containing protein [Tissierellales bacterium]|nr:GerMN domain-containing protein [Tissierellales bacterium]
MTPVKLYFQTKNYDLIPVYRFVENQDQLHNIIEEEMLKGPINEGLISPIDKVNYIILRDTVIYVDLPRDSQVYTGEYSENAYYAFVKSFSQLSNSTRIRFTFDNLVEESWFNGINVRNSIPYPDNINAYIPVLGGDRFYLSEKNILFDEEATLQEQSFRIYEYIKNNSNGYFQSLQGIDINSAELFQDTLVIDFNKSLSSIYEYNEDLQDLLLDSFLYSFTSIQGVNSLRITINGEPIESFGTYDLSEPITPYQYYNLETINENPA